MKNQKEIYKLMDYYNLNDYEKEELFKIIYPIFIHPEFQRRLTDEYLHHGTTTLGEHIIKDTITTYILCKRKKKINLPLALKISMLHDLYTLPWQNSDEHPKFFHKHGFRHPIEAAINAVYWFPEYFKDENDAKIIIDGIIHHMFPLPVSSNKDDDLEKIEINNVDIFMKLDSRLKKMILESMRRKRLAGISLSRSMYPEGKIMSKADKKVALREIKNFSSAKALLTGKNKSIK